jgi:hypothetical protein
MLTATLDFISITRDYSKTLARTAAEPTVTRATQYYLANIGNVKSVKDLVNNDKLYNYVMTAFGLSDMTFAKGLITKVLEGGVSSSKSLANTLNDPRYKALAAAFDFAANGSATTSAASAQQGTVSNYVEQTLETDVGKENQGTQMALYFQRMAPNITSVYNILGDKTLISVAQTAFGISPSTSAQNIDLQAKTLSSFLNVSDLQNPAKLKKFLERFTAMYDSQNTSPTVAPTTALLVTMPGISESLLLSIANLRLGGS